MGEYDCTEESIVAALKRPTNFTIHIRRLSKVWFAHRPYGNHRTPVWKNLLHLIITRLTQAHAICHALTIACIALLYYT